MSIQIVDNNGNPYPLWRVVMEIGNAQLLLLTR